MKVSKDAKRMWPSATAAVEAAGTNVPEGVMAKVITATAIVSGLSVSGVGVLPALAAGAMVFLNSMPMNVFLFFASSVYRFMLDGVFKGKIFDHLKVMANHYFGNEVETLQSNGKSFSLLDSPWLYAKTVLKTVKMSVRRSSNALLHMGLSLLVPFFFYAGLYPAIEFMNITGQVPFGRLLVAIAAFRGSIFAMHYAQTKLLDSEEFRRESYADEVIRDQVFEPLGILARKVEAVEKSGYRVEKRTEILNLMTDYLVFASEYKTSQDPRAVELLNETLVNFKQAMESGVDAEDREFISQVFAEVDLLLMERDPEQTIYEVMDSNDMRQGAMEVGHFRVLTTHVLEIAGWDKPLNLSIREKLTYMIPSMMRFTTAAAILGFGSMLMVSLFDGMAPWVVGTVASMLSSFPEYFNFNRYLKIFRVHAATTMVTGSQNVNAMGADLFMTFGTSVWGKPAWRKVKDWWQRRKNR